MKNPILLILLFLIVTSCNENFWGYNYDSPPLKKITRIQGTISDKFSGKPIQPATINVNGQETMTDENGNYILNYVIPEDIEPNQQEIGYLSIVAWNYIPYNFTFYIYPVQNIVDCELEYAVPTILDAVCNGDTVQSIIREYQGLSTIDYVSVTFKVKDSLGVWERKEFNMDIKRVINDTLGCYEHRIWKSIIKDSLRSDWYRITAKDVNGNVHRSDFTINLDDIMFY